MRKRKKTLENDAHAAARKAAARSATVRVLFTMTGFGCLVVGGFVLATWVGWSLLGASLLWNSGVLRAPKRRPRAEG